MPLDSREVSEEIHEGSLGSLRGCLVEGDPEQRSRERRVRRRALVLSILFQTGVLALLVLLPLFGKMEHIAFGKIYIPIPPYGHPHHSSGTTKPKPDGPTTVIRDIFPAPPFGRPVAPSHETEALVGPPDIGSGANEQENGPACNWCIDIDGKNSGPRPPETVTKTPTNPTVVYKPTIDPALLIHRVEPVYPPLARQMRREGRVEMRQDRHRRLHSIP